jgi:hypothetical protein
MAKLYVVRAHLGGEYDGQPRDGIFGYEPTVYADKAAADARAEVLGRTGEWGDGKPQGQRRQGETNSGQRPTRCARLEWATARSRPRWE